MASRGIVRRVAQDRAVLLVLAVFGVGVAYMAWRNLGSRTASLSLTAGRDRGLRHAMAESLADGAAANRVKLRLVSTAGSEEALDQVDAGRIDLALIQGGLDIGRRSNVRQLAVLHVEALDVLVKANLADAASRGLDALRGHRVNLGEPGSGTRALAAEVLQFAGLEPGTDYVAEGLGYDALTLEPSANALPDAVFMVSLLPSPVARHLVGRYGYRLVPLPFSEAFTLNGRAPDADDPAPEVHAVNRDHIVETTIPAYTYGVKPQVPAEPMRTLGARMLLVAHRKVDPEAAARLVDAAFNTPFAQLAHPPLSPAILDLPTEFLPHPGLLLHQERSKPMIAGDVVDSIEKQVSIGARSSEGPFSSGSGSRGELGV